MTMIQQSVLSTQYLRVLITLQTPDTYDPTGDTVQWAFTPATYPMTSPVTWYTGSWATFPGPAYYAQVLVGPANDGISLAIGLYQAWVKITDDPEVPVLVPFDLQITP
jgi:hypothetical protein